MYLDLKKKFWQSSPQQATMEARKCRRIKWKNNKMNGKLLKGKRNENGNKRCKIKMEKSGLWSITRSVLASMLFLIYINDMPEGVKSYMSLFADNAKLQRLIRNNKD